MAQDEFDQYKNNAEPEGALSRAFHAVGSGFKRPFEEAATLASDVNRAIGGGPAGVKALTEKYPPTHSIGQTLKSAYSSLNPLDVRRDEVGSVDIPATIGAT